MCCNRKCAVRLAMIADNKARLRSATGRDTDVATYRARIAGQLDDVQSTTGPVCEPTDLDDRIVLGVVVHHNDWATSGVQESIRDAGELVGPVAARDHKGRSRWRRGCCHTSSHYP